MCPPPHACVKPNTLSYDTYFKMNICTYVVPISNLVFILMYCLYNLQRSFHRSCGRVKLPHSFVAMERGKVSMSKMTQTDDQILWSIKPWWTNKISVFNQFSWSCWSSYCLFLVGMHVFIKLALFPIGIIFY